MSDLVERLREIAAMGIPDFTNSKLLNEAAARIDVLEAALREIIDRPNLPEREQAESVKTIARAALAQEQDK